MIIINDKDICPNCKSYWQSNGYCTNGHLRIKDEEILSIQLLEKQLLKKEKALQILLEYFDCIPDEDKREINRKLEELDV